MSNFPTVGRIHRSDPALDELIAPESEIELLEVGLAWSEGPVWVGDGDYLLFSDIPRNAIIQWSEAAGARIWMQPSGYNHLGNTPGRRRSVSLR